MRTKKSSYSFTISTMVTTEMREKIIELATEANISQGEFVRDAVEHYINYLNSLEENKVA